METPIYLEMILISWPPTRAPWKEICPEPHFPHRLVAGAIDLGPGTAGLTTSKWVQSSEKQQDLHRICKIYIMR